MNKIRIPLYETVESTQTDVWNDSCSLNEMRYAIANGAVGATTNPVIVQAVLSEEAEQWQSTIESLILTNPKATEEDIAWKIMIEVLLERAKLLLPVYKETKGKKGRIAIQVNAKYYRDADYMAEQAVYLHSLAPNITVKIPATTAGIEAMKKATTAGVNVLATVCFTVAQSCAVAESIEEGLTIRKNSGKDISTLYPACAIMVGRTDDWLKVIANRDNIITDPGYLEWAGVAVFKRSYRIFRKKKYTTRLMSAAYRNHFHWSQFIGGDVILTIPYKWQERFNASSIVVKPRMDDPVNPAIIKELEAKFPDFVKAYAENGLSKNEFDSYGALSRTMRSFTEGYDKLLLMIRNIMMPNPDL
ncbi:MAG: transaldolase family protein [Spirochaetales bacterium]|nr:transaldolase family protein [Spirochaetales bacterium]